jgi:FkbM family methyltransferase
VYAFEPGASSCRLLEQSAAANRFDSVRVFECAVSDREALVGYGMDDSNGRISHEQVATSALQVRAVTLDRALAGERKVDVIKIDVEGAEARVLRGAAELVQRDRPAIVSEFCPFGLRLASSVEPLAYLDQLRSLGYELRVIPVNGPVPAPESDARILEQVEGDGAGDHVDLLATPIP